MTAKDTFRIPPKPVGTVLDWKCGLCGGTMEVSHVHFLVHCNVPEGTGGAVSTPRWLYESQCRECGAGDKCDDARVPQRNVCPSCDAGLPTACTCAE